jgi:hypothetical protein
MSTLTFSLKKVTSNKLFRLGAKLSVVFAAASALSGCLLTSPFWNQEFADHTAAIPLQAWTTKKNESITFECSQAAHWGLTPFGGPYTWTHVATVMPEQAASLDPKRGKIYSAARDASLPSACWQYDSVYNKWYTAIRAKQGGTIYSTFDNAGLECLGREDGKAASWFGWIGKNCTKTYSNSSSNIPYVVFRAES